MPIAAVGGVLSTSRPNTRTEAETAGSSNASNSSSGTAGSSSTSGSSGSSASSAAGSASMLDRDAFLKLLVAQLKYQDPSKPADASAMISQSAQLSVVDKLEEISASINEASATNRLSLGGSIIGKQITFAGTDGVAITEVVTSVSFNSTTMVLRAGTWDVPIDAVASISQPPATTATGTTGTTGTAA